ncbi:SH3 domain-containing protein [Cyanobacteria bacterium FACHB-502]|nr:SH3 domain-containing protein [Cyanobacteria bacterium FACHB-502]
MDQVYLLQEFDFNGYPTGYYKIGKTKEEVGAYTRNRQLQGGNPRPVKPLHTISATDGYAVEAALHRRLSDCRPPNGGGAEWFYFGDTGIDFVIDIMNEYDENPVHEPSHNTSYEPFYDKEAVYFYENSYDSSPSYSGGQSDNLVAIGGVLAVLLGILVGVIVSFHSSQPKPAPARIDVPAVTGYAGANLRSEPKDGNEFIIGQVRSGEQVKAFEVSSDGKWRRVELSDGRSGWVANNFVK